MKKEKNKKKNKISSYIGKLFSTAGILLLFILAQVIAGIVATVMGYDDATSFCVFALIGSFVLSIVFILIYKKTLIKQFIDFKKNWKDYLLFSLICFAIGFGIETICDLIINNVIFNNSSSDNQQMVESFVTSLPILGFLSVVVFAPINEEIAFRLNFRKLFKNIIAFSVVTGLIFSAFHIVEFNSLKSLLQMIPYFVLGFTFGYAYFKTNNIFTTMIMHAINNLIGFLLVIMTAFL